MQQNALVLLPPIIVLIAAVITKRLPIALATGLLSGAFIATQGSIFSSVQLLGSRLLEQINDAESLYIYIFLLCIGSLIAVIERTGGATAFAALLRNNIADKKQIKNTSLAISALLSIDDYLSSLTVGHVMKPLIDNFHVARTKLAYMVHTFAAPLVILIPISTWGAFITSQIEQTGISKTNLSHVKIIADPFFIFLQTIPFIYYSFFTMLSAIFIVNRSISYGSMYNYEQAALKAPSRTSCLSIHDNSNAHLSDLMIPLCTLIISVLCGLLYMGNCYLFGGSESIICSLQQNKNAFLVLCTSGGITLCIAFLLALYRKQIIITDVPRILAHGCKLMLPVIILIVLASALGSILRLDLQTGRYLAQHLLHTISIAYLPFIFFIAGALCSSLIGLGWGSIALLLPIGVPMTFSMANSMGMHTSLSVIIPTIGAILAGSVFGDHTSPTSAAGEIAAASSGCTALEHAKTQYPYAIPPFLGAGIAYLITGQMLDFPASITAGVSLAIGALCTLLIILSMQRFRHTQTK